MLNKEIALTVPPTEVEIAGVLWGLESVGLHESRDMLRRLTYQRDVLLEEVKTLRKIKSLASQANIYCSSPGGRFGEDSCRKCPGCKLLALLREGVIQWEGSSSTVSCCRSSKT